MSTFPGYLLKATLVVVAVAAAAAWPVRAWAGDAGLVALTVASAVCLLGAALGRLPRLFLGRGPDAILGASMAGVGVRLLGTLAIAAPLMLLSGLPLAPFAVGLILAYFSLLVLEVWDLTGQSRRAAAQHPADPDGVPTR